MKDVKKKACKYLPLPTPNLFQSPTDPYLSILYSTKQYFILRSFLNRISRMGVQGYPVLISVGKFGYRNKGLTK